ncbi:MAG TPA: nicotinate-nucleotide--dimethylbenzimidazole phosphoribosyltransferase, partial [Vicinamibacteria bacterium]|nr:nicotinate-nucleotide--dimethylbenzimidazole phosphoribosyltransferase [Vicinamibacteria bacterium]
PLVARRRIVVFAADHGVTVEGVSAYPSEVTAQMVVNFVRGGAAVNALAGVANADVWVVDVGVAAPVSVGSGRARLVQRRVRNGTRNMAQGPAMSEPEMLAAVAAGIEQAEQAAEDGVALLGLGEMGIGNTTAASALTAALTGLPPSRVTGRGTGVSDDGLARKIAAVERALATNAPRSDDPLDVLQKVGGLEIAGLCGLCLGGARRGRALICDGFIATAGAALAAGLCGAVADYLFAAHRSPEPGHAVLLDRIGQRPLLDLEMRLGEGTGAALAMNVIGAAVAAFTEMATFESAAVTDAPGPSEGRPDPGRK